MELSPVIVFCYNRPWHVEQTLEALSKNVYAGESVLYIYCDGPKENASDEQKQKIKETRSVIRKKQWCKEVYIIEAEKNKGLANSIIDGVTCVVEKYGNVIVLEDDIVSSVGFLKFMNEALDLYKDEPNVMHISGYMYPHKQKLPDTFFYPVPYPGGGWATWQRAWKYYNDNTSELYKQWCGRWHEFDLFGGDYLSKQLISNYNGTLKTWFIKWYAVILRMNCYTLYPGQSLTNNIGFDETATNSGTMNNFDVIPVDYVRVYKCNVETNKKAKRIIYDFYQGHWYNRRRRNAFFRKLIFWK